MKIISPVAFRYSGRRRRSRRRRRERNVDTKNVFA